MDSFRPTFVRVEGSDHGLGKALERLRDGYLIEFFESPAGPRVHQFEFPDVRIRPIELSAETRVFCQDKQTLTWWPGRIAGGVVSAEALRSPEDHYPVRFPNGLEDLVPVSNLNVRWAHPIQDPTDYLAARITDTPFFFEGRTQIVRFIAAQRGSFGGLTALASSAIDLLPHQVTTIRRVLSDPIERYLLADEVGLGKTIEAGVLIRQHMIDRPAAARVMVVAPGHLVLQWERELKEKFYLQLGERVSVFSEQELLEHCSLVSNLTMLVVDEAHRGALNAFAANHTARAYFEALQRLARMASSVLLLSGTPVLHQEDGFLAMLHLLDPAAYPLEQRELFRQRVRDRQAIADSMSDLSDDASPYFVQEALTSIQKYGTGDQRLSQLCDRVRSNLNEDALSPVRIRAIRSLRFHLSEIYRLHRRLLRTHRDDALVQMLLPRRNGVQIIRYEDPARSEAFEFLESWRLECITEANREGKSPNANHVMLFAQWIEASLLDPSVLIRAIDRRLEEQCRSSISTATWAFSNEEEMLRSARELIAEGLRRNARTSRLIEWLRQEDGAKKAIVFVSDERVAARVWEDVRNAIAPDVVLLISPTEESSEWIEILNRARVVICTTEVEEGLNLQKLGAAIVHYDLPLESARIEQRIGRVDRLEARGRLRMTTFSSDQPYESEWLDCLISAVGVFNRSISPLQYTLVGLTADFRGRLLSEGVGVFAAASRAMRDPKTGLAAELRKIKAQEAIDAIEIEPDHDLDFFKRLEGAEEEAEKASDRAVTEWMVDRLQFVRQKVGKAGIRYIHDVARPTLVPIMETLVRFSGCVEREIGRRQLSSELPLQVVTFERSVAERTHMGLLRIGHPIFAGIEQLVRADDRGVAFAIWRQELSWSETPRCYLRFDFVIEVDIQRAIETTELGKISHEALRRRADEALPVRYQSVWLDSDLNEVFDQESLGILKRPYKRGRGDFGALDINVRRDRWDRVDRRITLADWEGLCRRGREVAEKRLRAREAVCEEWHQSSRAFRSAAERSAEVLSGRICRLDGPVRASEERTAALDSAISQALLAGIESPSIRLDSIGAVFISRQALDE